MIDVENLGKKYFKGEMNRRGYHALRDVIAEHWSGERKKLNTQESFWALKGINFFIEQGEVVGIIGKNGAGKSTLLKVLSRITAPTEGKAILKGSVGSLLEVGTGFHPELTGMENIYLNGTILGLSRKYINSRLDEIIDFSGVEEFLDMPIKRYSSGMQMRLAFAVAAHLDPEIMIIDEVLAVGDFEFQEKCLKKMKDASSSGRTVIYVSHNTNSIRDLCSRVIWLEKGEIKRDTKNVFEVTNEYLFGSGGSKSRSVFVNNDELPENEWFRLIKFYLCDDNLKPLDGPIPGSSSFYVGIDVDINKLNPLLNFGFSVTDAAGVTVFWSVTTDQCKDAWPTLKCGRNRLIAKIPNWFLNEGQYRVDLFASLHCQGYMSEPGNTSVSVQLQISGGLSESPYFSSKRPGTVAPILTWKSFS